MSAYCLTSPVSTVAPNAAQPADRFAAESALFELLSHVRDLRAGTGVFAALTAEERAEQLAQLIDTGAYMPIDEHVRGLPNDQLIELVGDDATSVGKLIAATREIERRLKVLPTTPTPEAPDAEDRFRIETDDEQYHRELTLEREAAEAEERLYWDQLARSLWRHPVGLPPVA